MLEEFVLWEKPGVAIAIIHVTILIMNCAYKMTSPAQASTHSVTKPLGYAKRVLRKKRSDV